MEEVKNLKRDDVLELIKDFPIEPTRGKLIITVNVTDIDEEGLSLSESDFSDSQFVLAVSDYSSNIKPGQKIILDTNRMMEYVEAPTDSYSKIGVIKLKPIIVNDRTFAIISESFVDALDNTAE